MLLARDLCLLMVLLSSLLLPRPGEAGAFILADESAPHRILHPQGYTGSQSNLLVEVCIDPASLVPSGAALTDMEQSVINNISTWNQLQPGVGNALLGLNNNIPSSSLDFESVALHELGHCIGLAHVNAASESDLSGSDLNYTKATKGGNGEWDINAGTDGVRGTLDDVRGDDVNLHWFRIDNNDPGALPLPVKVDSTTYTRDLASLPSGHLFAQNLDRDAAGTMGHTDTSTTRTEAVMQQGTYSDEAQRSLTADGVATLMLGMSGADEAAGTADDYTLTLVYGGISSASSCDLSMKFENDVGLAYCSVGYSPISSPSGTSHYRITNGYMRYGAEYNWFFNQSGDTCNYSVSPTSRSFTPAGGSNSFNVTASSQCHWRPGELDSWITVTSGVDSGNGTVTYTVAANANGSSRSGTISVGGKTHSITQDGVPCSYSISSTSGSYSSSGGSDSFNVTAPAGCNWTPVKSDAWITLTSGSDSGNGTVSFSVAANNNINSRSGTITLQGQTYTINQSGAPCTYSLSPTSESFNSSSDIGSFGVTAPSGCAWTPVESDSWIALTSGAGSGNGTVSYTVSANTGINSRSGSIDVGGETHGITQSGVGCSYSINPTSSGSLPASGSGGSFNVTAAEGCGWTPDTSDSWITLTSGSGSGNGSVSYSVAENTSSDARSGTITVGGATYNINQSGVSCSYAISPASNSLTSAGGSSSFDVNAPLGCDWTPVESAPWITLTSGAGSGNGEVSYGVAENTSSNPRTGTITVGSETYTINQSGVSCSYALSPASNSFTPAGGSSSLGVTAPSGCDWTPLESNPWIKLTSGAGSGNGTVSYSVTENTSTDARSGSITIQDQNYNINQEGAAILPEDFCNEKTVSDITENASDSHEACETLVLGPSFSAEDGSSVTLSSGLEVEIISDVFIEQGATLEVKVCGQSLCETSNKPMPDGCHSCVTSICEIDASCCVSKWSQACLDKVYMACELVCE